jgi:hypothetical protein
VLTLRITGFLDIVHRPSSGVSGHRPSSGILNTRKHNVLKTGSSVEGKETSTLYGPLERANLTHWIKVIKRLRLALSKDQEH